MAPQHGLESPGSRFLHGVKKLLKVKAKLNTSLYDEPSWSPADVISRELNLDLDVTQRTCDLLEAGKSLPFPTDGGGQDKYKCQCWEGWRGEKCELCGGGGKVLLKENGSKNWLAEAVYSGLVKSKSGDYQIKTVPEVVGDSGTMLLHFYSDVAYNMTGFNISFTVDSCPSKYPASTCSGRGSCDDVSGTCQCDADQKGPACEVLACPDNCGSSDKERRGR